MKKPRTLHKILTSLNYGLVTKLFLENVVGDGPDSMDPVKISSRTYELATDANRGTIKGFCIIQGSSSCDALTKGERAKLKRGEFYLFYVRRE